MGIRAITFDVYSALYDTVSGLEQALRALLQTRGTGGDPAALARVWRQRHMEYLLIANSLDREPARNRTALEASARHTLAALRPPLSRDELSHLIDAWETLPPWPDTVRVLTGPAPSGDPGDVVERRRRHAGGAARTAARGIRSHHLDRRREVQTPSIGLRQSPARPGRGSRRPPAHRRLRDRRRRRYGVRHPDSLGESIGKRSSRSSVCAGT